MKGTAKSGVIQTSHIALLIACILGCENSSHTSRYLEFERNTSDKRAAYQNISFEILEKRITKRSNPVRILKHADFMKCEVFGQNARYLRHPIASDFDTVNRDSKALTGARSSPFSVGWFTNGTYTALVQSGLPGVYQLNELDSYDLLDLEFKYFMAHLAFYPPINQWIRQGSGKITYFGEETLNGSSVLRLDMDRKIPDAILRNGSYGDRWFNVTYYLSSDTGACLEVENRFPAREPSGLGTVQRMTITYALKESEMPVPVSRTLKICSPPSLENTIVHDYLNVMFNPQINAEAFNLRYYGLPEPRLNRWTSSRILGLVSIGLGAAIVIFLAVRKRTRSMTARG